MSKILITGGAGFIGSHAAKALIAEGDDVVLLDNFDGLLYDPELKKARLEHLFAKENRPRLISGDILDAALIDTIFAQEKFDKVLHLAALANPGVSINHPEEYTSVNILGTLNILLACTKYEIVQLVAAGSSSVYNDEETPFEEHQYPLNPRSPYGASKAAMETYCKMWHDLYDLQITVLRFFSVYGPWGRPDMAPMIFAERILEDEVLEVTPDRQRDFTYIDDIVSGILLALHQPLGYEVLNIGHGSPVSLQEFIAALGKAAGKTPKTVERVAPIGEMKVTYANTAKANRLLGYKSQVSMEEGAKKLIDWLKTYKP